MDIRTRARAFAPISARSTWSSREPTKTARYRGYSRPATPPDRRLGREGIDGIVLLLGKALRGVIQSEEVEASRFAGARSVVPPALGRHAIEFALTLDVRGVHQRPRGASRSRKGNVPDPL